MKVYVSDVSDELESSEGVENWLHNHCGDSFFHLPQMQAARQR